MNNKENTGSCPQCRSATPNEHVCSSQQLSDSIDALSDLATQQLHGLETFSLVEIHHKCQQELENWHSAAISHLSETYTKRLSDLARVYTHEVCPDVDKFKEKMIELMKTRIMPRISKVLDDVTPDVNKIERMQAMLSHVKGECTAMRNRPWINLQLPDVKTWSIPIQISKMATPAQLSEGSERDPTMEWSDEEGEKGKKDSSPVKKKLKKQPSIEVLSVFVSAPEAIRTFFMDTNSSTLALSTTHILVHDNRRLILFDFKKILTEMDWNDNENGILVDICWMPALSVFVILTIHSVFLFDPLKPIPIKIEAIQPLDRTHVLASISPFDRDLYINYHKGVHLDQYRLSATTAKWTLERRYAKVECCETTDLGIRDVRSDSSYLCLSIMQQDDLKWRLDLMTRDMVRVRRGVAMDAGENQHKFFSMLSPLYDQRWLFVNWFTNKLWIVDQQGKTRLIKESKVKNIRNISMTPDGSYMAVRTEKPSAVKLYKLE